MKSEINVQKEKLKAKKVNIPEATFSAIAV